jgi:hypothetical protein
LLIMAGSSFCTFECANLWEHLTQDGTRFRGAGLLILILAPRRELDGSLYSGDVRTEREARMPARKYRILSVQSYCKEKT